MENCSKYVIIDNGMTISAVCCRRKDKIYEHYNKRCCQGSRCFSGDSVKGSQRKLNVSDESTKKVNETIARLNYSPNFLGRNLRKCETNVILVIMPTSEHSLYSKIVMGMQDYAGQVGYDIITAVSYSTSTAETRQMNMLFNRTVDGVILLGTQYDADSLNFSYRIDPILGDEKELYVRVWYGTKCVTEVTDFVAE